MSSYLTMNGGEFLEAVGTDHYKWAAAFNEIAQNLGHPPLDEEWLAGWFANAIMAGHDRAAGTSPVRLPDGSGFFIASG